MKKLFTLMTLALLSIGSAWGATNISCSAFLSDTQNSPTTTNCTFLFYSQDDSKGNIPSGTKKTVNSIDYYYSKMNDNKNFYEITLNHNNETKFQAGDIITVYLYTNDANPGYCVGKSTKTEVSLTNQTSSTIVEASHTLTVNEIESDGTVRIYRKSSKTYFAGVSVTGSHKTEATLTFAEASGSANIVDGTSFTLPTLTKTPANATITYSSSDETVATVNESTGAVTLVHAGVTKIKASFAGDNNYAASSATFTLTVTNTALATITVTYDISGVTGIEGTAPASFSIDEDETFTIPVNQTLYVEGKTLTGWLYGENTYAIGATVTAAATDMNLTPVFTENPADAYLGKVSSTVTWQFQTKEGAPTWAHQGDAAYVYVTQMTIGSNKIDMPMTMDASSGKIANANWGDWCQMNGGTKLTVPVIEGAVLQLYVYGEGGDQNNSPIPVTFGGVNGSYASNIYSYTATTAGDLDIVIGNQSYIRYLTVTYPSETAVYNHTTDNTAIAFTKANINANDFLTVSTDNWQTNKDWAGYQGDFYNMSTNSRTLTIKVKGASSFEVYVQNSTSGRQYTVKIGSADAQTITHQGTGIESSGLFSISDPTETTTIVLAGATSSSASVYPVYAVFNPNVTVTLATSGVSSFSSAKALDFSGVEGLSAYVVSELTADAAKLTKVTKAPAETGLILKGTASTEYTIPVVASAEGVGTNKLKPAVTATDVTDISTYVINGGEFKIFTGESIPAGKSYLLATDVPAGSRLAMLFDNEENEASGISDAFVDNGSKIYGQMYNLNGQRISQPTKGLNIIGGKKYIVK